jgi:hypothetical protein
MSEVTNSAERLYVILTKAKEIASRPMNCMAGWASVFEVELLGRNSELVKNPNDQHPIIFHYNVQTEILHRLIELNHLITEIEEKIKQVEEINHDLYLKPYAKIRIVVSPTRLTDNFGSILSEITESDMVIVQFCSEQLKKIFPEKSVDESLLKELLTEIQNLYEKVKDSEIEFKLKNILLDLLETMRQALYEYRIRGFERIEEAIQRLIGIYSLNKENIENSNVEEIGKIKKLLRKFGSLYSFAADTVQLLGAGEIITKLLGK